VGLGDSKDGDYKFKQEIGSPLHSTGFLFLPSGIRNQSDCAEAQKKTRHRTNVILFSKYLNEWKSLIYSIRLLHYSTLHVDYYIIFGVKLYMVRAKHNKDLALKLLFYNIIAETGDSALGMDTWHTILQQTTRR